MAHTKAEIAIVEDRKAGRDDFKDMADDLAGERGPYSVNVPPSFDELQRLFLFRNLDGFLIDVNLRQWDLSKRVIKRIRGVNPIRDGIDIAHLAFNLFGKAKDAICIYSSEVDLEEPWWKQRLESLPFSPTVGTKLSSYREAEEYFKLLLEKAGKVRMANPLLQPPNFARMSPKDRLQAYRSIHFNSAKWRDCNFSTVGDYAWMVVCGHSVEKDSYGSPLNGARGDEFGIKPMDKYPDLKALNAISKRHNSFPFILWNTRKPEFLEQQFKQAGEKLMNIPPIWRSFFGIAMARPCAKAYVDDREHRVLKWCRALEDTGKIEVTKRIYKRLLGQTSSNLSEFKRAVQRFELPQIVDVLEAKIEDIDEKESNALVVLQSAHGGAPFKETFDLKILRQANIKLVDQRFDYTVYQQPWGDSAVNIELHYAEEEDI